MLHSTYNTLLLLGFGDAIRRSLTHNKMLFKQKPFLIYLVGIIIIIISNNIKTVNTVPIPDPNPDPSLWSELIKGVGRFFGYFADDVVRVATPAATAFGTYRAWVSLVLSQSDGHKSRQTVQTPKGG